MSAPPDLWESQVAVWGAPSSCLALHSLEQCWSCAFDLINGLQFLPPPLQWPPAHQFSSKLHSVCLITALRHSCVSRIEMPCFFGSHLVTSFTQKDAKSGFRCTRAVTVMSGAEEHDEKSQFQILFSYQRKTNKNPENYHYFVLSLFLESLDNLG